MEVVFQGVRDRELQDQGNSQGRARRRMPLLARLPGVLVLGLAGALMAQTPAVGTKAPDFTLRTPAGTAVRLSDEVRKGPTVLVVLRGYPGYQCPFCTKQVHDFVQHADAFAAKKAEVVLVYPGPPGDLDAHAKEFLAQQQAALPKNMHLLTDPDYVVTKQYGLRWDAPHETAYPSAFVLDGKGEVVFAKVSHEHGGRVTAEEVLATL